MIIHTRQADEVTVVELIGRLDTQTSGAAHDKMARITSGDVRKVVFDLKGLDYVSSVGLLVIINTAKLLTAAGGELKVCGANGVVKQVLEISRLEDIVKTYNDAAEAIADF